MQHAYLSSGCLKTLLCLALGLCPLKAHALQPLEEFLSRARSHSFDARVQDATEQQRAWEVQAAIGRLLPSLTARGVYQRNQYEAAVRLPNAAESVVITPHDQLDAFFQLDVPILDLGNFHRTAQARHLEKAARARSKSSASAAPAS
jgi:outer membrane protein TolC